MPAKSAKKTRKAPIPESIRAYVMTAFAGCVACGTRDATHCGHVVAESKGGAMTKENFVRLCAFCNLSQNNVHVAFGAHVEAFSRSAPYGDVLDAIELNRAYWSRYCSSARGGIKLNPYIPSVIRL